MNNSKPIGCLPFLLIVGFVIWGFNSVFGGSDDEKPAASATTETTQPAKPKPKPAKFTGTSKSAQIVTRQAYGAAPDGKNGDDVPLVRSASCSKYECTISLRPTMPFSDPERETLEEARPLFKRLFRLDTLDSATLKIYGKTTSIGGKESVSQVAELTCTRWAHDQIDWDNVDEDGMKALCSWEPMVNVGG